MRVKQNLDLGKLVTVSVVAMATTAITAWSQGAPIVYKQAQTNQSYTSATTRSYSAPRSTTSSYSTPSYNTTSSRSYSTRSTTSTNGAGVSRAQRRVDFSYPTQQNTYSRSSNAQQYAHAGSTYSASSSQVNDPVIVGNEFDGLATAGRIEARRSMQRVDEMGLAPVAPVAVASTSSSNVPVAGPAFNETGWAVVYDDAFDNQPTANGELFQQSGMTAAHPSLPLPSLAQVINRQTGQEIVVRINDRGPFEDNASIQLSKKAADLLQFGAGGRGQVEVRYLGPAPVMGQMPRLVEDIAETDNFADVQLAGAPIGEVPVAVPASSAPQNLSFGSGFHFVQVGAFSDLGNAQALSSALSAGLPVDISQAVVNGADFFRVRVGPLETEALAESMRAHLSEQGIADGHVVRDDQ